jgi:hypothetical protein
MISENEISFHRDDKNAVLGQKYNVETKSL